MRYSRRRQHSASFAALAGTVAALAGAGPAQAAAPVPFTLVDHVDFTGPPVETFTATGPLCPSGSFTDDILVTAFARSDHARSNGGVVLIRSTYTCADGSGTFTELKHLRLTFTPDGGNTTVGPVEITGGTGAYAGIRGQAYSTGGTGPDNIGGGTTTGVITMPGR
jgi:hypothetical protein